jgi:hypothetical protein
MRPIIQILASALLFAGIYYSCQAADSTPEPVYDGQPLSYWLTNVSVLRTGTFQMFPYPSREGVYRPPKGLLGDSNAVPFLTRVVGGNSKMQVAAMDYLSQMGAMARPAVPSLIWVLKEDDSWFARAYAAAALGMIGKGDTNVTAALTEALIKDDLVRQVAADSLRYLGVDPLLLSPAVKSPSP